MANLQDNIEEMPGSGIFVPAAARFTNTTGTPIVSATAQDDGTAIADAYDLTFATVVPSASARVTVVSTGTISNPYDSVVVGPTPPIVNPVGAIGSEAYEYQLVFHLADGSACVSDLTAISGGSAFLDTNNYNAVSWTPPEGTTSVDVYRLTGGATQGKIVTGLTGTSYNDTGAAGDSTNPGPLGWVVVLDGSTSYQYIVPGVAIVFSNSGSFSSSWAAEIRIGNSVGLFAPGAAASSGIRHKAINLSGVALNTARAKLQPVVRQVRTEGRLFTVVSHFASGGVCKKVSGRITAYVATVANVNGSGSSKKADLLIDGSVITVFDVTTSGSNVISTQLNVTDVYQVVSGGLAGLQFTMDQLLTAASQSRLLVWEVANGEIAPDVAGVAGTYGTTDVTLTETGQSAGVITSSGSAFFWTRFNSVGPTQAGLSCPFQVDVALTANTGSGVLRPEPAIQAVDVVAGSEDDAALIDANIYSATSIQDSAAVLSADVQAGTGQTLLVDVIDANLALAR